MHGRRLQSDEGDRYVGLAIGDGLLDTQLEISTGDLFRPRENALIGLVLLADVHDHRTAPLQLLGELGGRHLGDVRASGLEQLCLRLCFRHLDHL